MFEGGFAGGDAAYRGDQGRAGRVFEQEAARAGLEGGEDVVVGVEGGEDQHLGAAGLGHLSGGLDAVHGGHPDVHEGYVGCGGLDEPDRLEAVGCGADDGQV